MSRRLNFNARWIDALRPGDKSLEFWDTDLTGFGVRISPKGVKSFTLIYRFNGRQARIGLGRYPHVSLADARKQAKLKLADVHHGVNPVLEKRASRVEATFGELVVDYLKHHARVKKRTWKADEAMFERDFLPAWRHRKLSTITRPDVRDALDPLRQRGKGVTANRGLSLLRTLFRYGMENDWNANNPCLGLTRLVPENRRDVVLSDEQIRTLWCALDDVCSEDISKILRLQLLTAQRIGEVMRMAWDQIDLLAGVWTIPQANSKNKRAHTVPLCSTALKLLVPTESASLWVFPAPRDRNRPIGMSTLHKALMQLRRATNVECRTHDLRRTAATKMAESGVSPVVLAKILNHADHTVTGRHYIWHSYDPQKRIALAGWDSRVAAIVAGKDYRGNVVQFA